MAMPEASVDKDRRSAGGEHQIGFAGQFFTVEAVAQALSVQRSSEQHFRLGVLAAYPGHVEPALLWGERIDSTRQAWLGSPRCHASSASDHAM